MSVFNSLAISSSSLLNRDIDRRAAIGLQVLTPYRHCANSFDMIINASAGTAELDYQENGELYYTRNPYKAALGIARLEACCGS